MKTISKKILFIISFSLILSCNNVKEKPIDNKNNELRILIRANDDCTNILTLNRDGNGEVIRGIGNSYRETFTKLKSVNERYDYSIKSNEDLNFINETLDVILKNKTVELGYINDAPRYELYIGKEKKIDMYSTKSDIFFKVLKKVWKNLPKEINYDCE